MNQLLNLGMGLLSLLFLLAALVMDFFDHKTHSVWMRAIYCLGLLGNAGQLQRFGADIMPGGPMWCWFGVTAILFVRKLVEFRRSEQARKAEGIHHLPHRRSSHATA